MRACEHRDVGKLAGQRTQIRDEGFHGRQQHALTRVAKHQRIGDVVDVLGSAGEVQEGNELAGLRRNAFELLAQEILDGLDVVIRDGLQRLDAAGIVDREIVDDRVQNVLDR